MDTAEVLKQINQTPYERACQLIKREKADRSVMEVGPHVMRVSPSTWRGIVMSSPMFLSKTIRVDGIEIIADPELGDDKAEFLSIECRVRF